MNKHTTDQSKQNWFFKNAFLKLALLGPVLFIAFIFWFNHKAEATVKNLDEDLANQMEQLPMVLNDEVTWVSIIRNDHLIEVTYQVQDENDAELTNYYVDINMEEEFGELCKTSDFIPILGKGYIWEHIYLSVNGAEISRASLTYDYCKQLKSSKQKT